MTQKPTYPAFDEAGYQRLQADFDQSVQAFANIDPMEGHCARFFSLPYFAVDIMRALIKDGRWEPEEDKKNLKNMPSIYPPESLTEKNNFIPYPTTEDLYSTTGLDKKLNVIKNEEDCCLIYKAEYLEGKEIKQQPASILTLD